MRRSLVIGLVLAVALPAAALAAVRLRQEQCVAPARGCTRAVAVGRPTGIAASPDGRTLVVRNGVGSLGSLGVFTRDRRNGKLRQLQCVARNVRRCADGRGLETPSAIAFSPDGRSVYVTAQNGRSVGIYRRLAGGKLVSRGSVGHLMHPVGVAVSPDGGSVYVGGDRLWVFARASNGSLKLLQSQPDGGRVAVAPDGRDVYAANGGGRHGTLATYTRAPDGRLQLAGVLDETSTQGLEQPAQLAFGRDGSLYVAATVSGAITRYTRSADGTLSLSGIVRGLPRLFGLDASGPNRVYAAYGGGIAELTGALRRLAVAKVPNANGVVTLGTHVYATSQGRITVLAH